LNLPMSGLVRKGAGPGNALESLSFRAV